MTEVITPGFDDASRSAAASAEVDGAFRTQVLQSVRHYATERSDFMDAYQHARQAGVEELIALGHDPDEVLAITFDNGREVINSTFAAGRNPAHAIYDFPVGRRRHPPSPASIRAAGASREGSVIGITWST